MQMQRYDGTPDAPYPPCGPGWSIVEHEPENAPALARAASMLGELPVYHYRDELLATGVHRFFVFELPIGQHRSVGALRFTGVDAVLPDQGEPAARGGTTGAPIEAAGTLGDYVDPIPAGGAADSGGTSYGSGGAGGAEPIPQSDATCTWVPDASNPKAVAIAVAISYKQANAPAPFVDQTVYGTTIDGAAWRFVMWSGDCRGDGGTYNCVSAFRCVPKGPKPAPPGPAQASSGIALLVGIAVLAITGLVAASRGKAHHVTT